ncbi:thiol-disulfide oxidoreductase DCC family protein [Tenacibaculum sp. TC6]|uniref:thiol-disulfide oxidoreductase DCC family protein n=1 Tax=Tenacibaculum sp. TC6 TaxID=3423223 RepID=UPI003D36B326
MIDLPKNKKVILFDGVCNFCNSTVLKIIKLDKNNHFVFTSLQSDTGKEITSYLGIDTSTIDSIVLYEPSVSYEIKSTAAIKIMADFGSFWKLAKILLIIPTRLRDVVYDYIAKNRYAWFGKKDACMIPSPELKNKFI